MSNPTGTYLYLAENFILDYRCDICGKGYPLCSITDLGYLGDGGEFDALPPILGFRCYCPEYNLNYHRVYSIKGEWIGKKGFNQYIHEMEWIK